MKTKTNAPLIHPMGEGGLDFKFLPAGGQFHLRGSDEALTPYGGLVAWDHFLERCGVIAEQMIHHAIPPNAVADWDSTVIPRYGKQEDPAIDVPPSFSNSSSTAGVANAA